VRRRRKITLIMFLICELKSVPAESDQGTRGVRLKVTFCLNASEKFKINYNFNQYSWTFK
jgi:hypothetical protein